MSHVSLPDDISDEEDEPEKRAASVVNGPPKTNVSSLSVPNHPYEATAHSSVLTSFSQPAEVGLGTGHSTILAVVVLPDGTIVMESGEAVVAVALKLD